MAGEAEARQARSTGERDWPTLERAASTGRAQPRASTRGRPGPAARPTQGVDQREGALASTRTARQALSDQPGGVILATTDLDPTHLPPPEMLAGDTGPVHGERGCRCVKDPQCFASSR